LKINKSLKGIVFADIKSFGRFSDPEIRNFTTKVLPDFVSFGKKRGAEHINTWGDAIVAFFDNVSDALRFAFDLRDYVRDTDWVNDVDYGYKNEVKIRIALHAAEVHTVSNRQVPGGSIFGGQISLAARIEPISMPNEVFASEAAANFIKAQKDSATGNYATKCLGKYSLPKEHVTQKIYWVRKKGESPKLVDSSAINRNAYVIQDTEAALSEIGKMPEPVRSIKVLNSL